MKFEKLNLEKFQENLIEKPDLVFGGATTGGGVNHYSPGTLHSRILYYSEDETDGGQTTYNGTNDWADDDECGDTP